MPFLSTKNKQDRSEISLNIQGRVEQEQKAVAEELANYFSIIADHIGGPNAPNATIAECEQYDSVKRIASRYNPNSFNFRTVKHGEVLLMDLNGNKATGYDQIPPMILKLAAAELAPSVTDLFNKAITENNWPQAWKKGEWVPVFKKDDPRRQKEVQANYHLARH